MCYSAQIRQDFDRFVREYGASIDIATFVRLYWDRREGAKVKIADVRFEGNVHVKAARLKGAIETKKWWMFSWLTGSGRFKDDQFDDDLDKLRDFYRELGYLDVEIPQDKVLFNYPSPERLVLVVHIDEGKQYHIGDITFSGNKLFDSGLLGRVVRQKKAYPVYDDGYKANVEAIRSELALRFPTLHLVGRNGMHKYNNQDHAMMTAMLTVKNILAGQNLYDVWNVNEDAEYHESGTAGEREALSSVRLVPARWSALGR